MVATPVLAAPVDTGHPVGSNEAASIVETQRILDHCGFDRSHDRALYLALEVMIAGSIFDARPQPVDRRAYNTAEVIHAGGPLAPHLGREMERMTPGWRTAPDVERALELGERDGRGHLLCAAGLRSRYRECRRKLHRAQRQFRAPGRRA